MTLLYPAAHLIAEGDGDGGPWTADEIGQKIKASMADWPKAANVPELIF